LRVAVLRGPLAFRRSAIFNSNQCHRKTAPNPSGSVAALREP
jgi:hypothetical protein